MSTKSSERSKYLSYLLRHKPEAAHLALDREGWCDLVQLFENTDFTLPEIELLVANDSKGRYELKYWEMADDSVPHTHEPIAIRAVQGHSTDQVRVTFKTAVPPVVLYHGTVDSNLDEIRKKGLLPMKRHHVHLSADLNTAETVGGRRRGGVVVFEIDAKTMLEDGHKFFIAENGVWLINTVPPKYLKARP